MENENKGLIDVRDCPCDGCQAKPCGHPARCVKFTFWLNKTVDAVEVVHGEWTMVIDENDCECIECPLCGERFYDGDNDTFDKPYNYCPNCGAKMDGDGND